jgi:hypothetical protein
MKILDTKQRIAEWNFIFFEQISMSQCELLKITILTHTGHLPKKPCLCFYFNIYLLHFINYYYYYYIINIIPQSLLNFKHTILFWRVPSRCVYDSFKKTITTRYSQHNTVLLYTSVVLRWHVSTLLVSHPQVNCPTNIQQLITYSYSSSNQAPETSYNYVTLIKITFNNYIVTGSPRSGSQVTNPTQLKPPLVKHRGSPTHHQYQPPVKITLSTHIAIQNTTP